MTCPHVQTSLSRVTALERRSGLYKDEHRVACGWASGLVDIGLPAPDRDPVSRRSAASRIACHFGLDAGRGLSNSTG